MQEPSGALADAHAKRSTEGVHVPLSKRHSHSAVHHPGVGRRAQVGLLQPLRPLAVIVADALRIAESQHARSGQGLRECLRPGGGAAVLPLHSRAVRCAALQGHGSFTGMRVAAHSHRAARIMVGGGGTAAPLAFTQAGQNEVMQCGVIFWSCPGMNNSRKPGGPIIYASLPAPVSVGPVCGGVRVSPRVQLLLTQLRVGLVTSQDSSSGGVRPGRLSLTGSLTAGAPGSPLASRHSLAGMRFPCSWLWDPVAESRTPCTLMHA